jgi:hypothetical protein
MMFPPQTLSLSRGQRGRMENARTAVATAFRHTTDATKERRFARFAEQT